MSRSQALLAALALVAAAFFANLLVSVVGGRVDLTEDRTFTLSPASRRLVGKLDEPVKLELFVSRADVKLGAYRESYARRVETLLRQYVAASGGKLRLIVTDPKPDTKDEQRAQRHGLNGIRTAQGTGYLGLTAQQADTVKGIGYLDPTREKFLEYDLSKLVASVTRLERPKLALINTLNISNEVPPGQDQQAGPADVLLAELGQTFQVVTLSNQATELPAGVAVVVLLHPHHLADKLAYAVDQFLLGGGQVFAAVDPLSRFQKFQQGGMPFMMAPMALGASSDAALLRGWGVNVELDAVTGDLNRNLPIRGARGEPVQYPPAIAVGRESLNLNSPLTSELHELQLMEAGSVSLISGAEKGVRFEPLITLQGAAVGAITTTAANAGPFEKVSLAFRADAKPRVVAALASGSCTSAFPKGAPAEEAKPADGKPAAPAAPAAPKAPAAPHLAVSAKPGRLLVVADADFLLDPFSVRQRQAGGQTVAEPANDNLAFVLNSVEALVGNDDLGSLRTKGTALRPFKVVEDLNRKAQVDYQAKLDEIEKQLEAANARIAELGRSQGDLSKGLIVTPEIQRELEKAQKQAEKFMDDRREIRRQATEEVTSLGRRLQLLNLLAGPLLAALVGLAYFLLRRRSSN
jgi:ABC-type uncharacterized transport system involved in gliding motility auxiliary subunit